MARGPAPTSRGPAQGGAHSPGLWRVGSAPARGLLCADPQAENEGAPPPPAEGTTAAAESVRLRLRRRRRPICPRVSLFTGRSRDRSRRRLRSAPFFAQVLPLRLQEHLQVRPGLLRGPRGLEGRSRAPSCPPRPHPHPHPVSLGTWSAADQRGARPDPDGDGADSRWPGRTVRHPGGPSPRGGGRGRGRLGGRSEGLVPGPWKSCA